ncbi:MAG: YkvA family protein [Micromonosporaceae bacterium]
MALAVGLSLIVCWLALVVLLLVVRPGKGLLAEAVRLLPDLVRFATRLAADPSLPRGVRWRLGMLAGYLAFPIDLIPDVIPILGYADDAIITVWVLRSAIRRTGVDRARRLWPGTDTGFGAVLTLCGLSQGTERA